MTQVPYKSLVNKIRILETLAIPELNLVEWQPLMRLDEATPTPTVVSSASQTTKRPLGTLASLANPRLDKIFEIQDDV